MIARASRHASSLLRRCIEDPPLGFIFEIDEREFLTASIKHREKLRCSSIFHGDGKRRA